MAAVRTADPGEAAVPIASVQGDDVTLQANGDASQVVQGTKVEVFRPVETALDPITREKRTIRFEPVAEGRILSAADVDSLAEISEDASEVHPGDLLVVR